MNYNNQDYINFLEKEIVADGIDINDFAINNLARGCFGSCHLLSNDDWYVPFGMDKTDDTRCEFCYKMGIVEECYGPIKCNISAYHPSYKKNIQMGVCCDSPNDSSLFQTTLGNINVCVIHPRSPYYLMPTKRDLAKNGIGHYMMPTQASYNIKVNGIEHYQCYIDGVLVVANTDSFYYVAKTLDEVETVEAANVPTLIEIKYKIGDVQHIITLYLHCFQSDYERKRDNLCLTMEDYIISKIKLVEYIDLLKATTNQINTQLENIKIKRENHKNQIDNWLNYTHNLKNDLNANFDNFDNMTIYL
jgi:hypothetical protein